MAPLLEDDWHDEGVEDGLHEQAVALGLPPIKGVPDFTYLVGKVIEEHIERPDAGRGVYKYLAALSHGTTYATLQRYGVTGPGDNPFTQRMDAVVSMQSVEFLVRATVGAHVSAVDRAITYCGSDRWAWDGWRRKVGRDLRHGPSLTIR